MTSKQKPKLGYWDIRAIGEPIRFLLNYLEIDFEDYRIPLGEGENIMVPWTSQKNSHGLDLPNLPFYIDEDVKLTQSQAILEYIGGKHNLCGGTLQEKATAGMVAQALNDLRWQSWLAYNATDFHEIKEDWKQTIPGRFSEINKFMEGKKYILGKNFRFNAYCNDFLLIFIILFSILILFFILSLGSKICYADFVLYECVEWFRAFAPDIFEESEELANVNNLRKRIGGSSYDFGMPIFGTN